MMKMYWIRISLLFLLSVINGQNTPEQIHLSIGDADDIVVVMWATKSDIQGLVRYGLQAGEMNSTAKSSISVLQSNSWNALKYIHRAEMKGLKPWTIYHYQVEVINTLTTRAGATTSTSDIYSFRLPHANQTYTKVLVYGDLGALEGKITYPVLEKEVKSGQYDVVWHIGDLGYDLETNGGQTGDHFLREIQPVAARIPYMTAPGNHELRDDLHHYRTRFSMPRSGWPMRKNKLWYTYDIGPVHYISYSTEVYFINNQNGVCEQFDWLLQDLMEANKNRHIRPWIVAMGHRPMYCSNSDRDDCAGRVPIFNWRVKYGLEELFYAQGVDLIIEAHEHSYERLWPVYDKKVISKDYNNPRAPVHVVSGAAGCNEGVEPMGKGAPWSAFRADSTSFHSYGRLTIFNSTHLFFEQITVSPHKVLDEFWLIQDNHGPNVKDLNCQDSRLKRHSSCSCPLPFHYITVEISAGVFLLLVIVLSVALCCVCVRNSKPCCRCKCIRNKISCCGCKRNTFRFVFGKRDRQQSQNGDTELLMSEDQDDEII